MRSVWKGHIRFSLVTIPIQIFNAVETKGNISFRQIHNTDKGPVGYKKYCKTCEETVGKDDIVKGFEYEPDQYAIFSAEELDNIKLESTKAIDIEAFVDINEVHPSRFETVYFIGPSGEVAAKTFNLFTTTLKNSGKAGVGKISLRDKEDVILLTEHKGGLLMYKLRYPEELRKMSNVPDLIETEVDETQLKLAETLVTSLTKSFEDIVFEDKYKNALKELVNSKVEGKQVITIGEEESDTPVVDIMAALKKSIEDAKAKGA